MNPHLEAVVARLDDDVSCDELSRRDADFLVSACFAACGNKSSHRFLKLGWTEIFAGRLGDMLRIIRRPTSRGQGGSEQEEFFGQLDRLGYNSRSAASHSSSHSRAAECETSSGAVARVRSGDLCERRLPLAVHFLKDLGIEVLC